MFHWNWVRIFWSLCSASNVFFLYWLVGGSFERGVVFVMTYAAAIVVYALTYSYPGAMPGETPSSRERDEERVFRSHCLEALVTEAGEVMRKRWLRSFELSGLGNADTIRPCDVVKVIHSLPCVTLTDLDEAVVENITMEKIK